jgi:hypothetical protein
MTNVFTVLKVKADAERIAAALCSDDENKAWHYGRASGLEEAIEHLEAAASREANATKEKSDLTSR